MQSAVGRLDVITGPMFAGKSTELLRRIRRLEHAGRKCVVVKWSGDRRYGHEELLVTHDFHKREAITTDEIRQVVDDPRVLGADVVGIDEGQFFGDIVESSARIVELNKVVIVSCLDGTFEQEPFPNIARLLSKADTVTKFSAVCGLCKEDAPFTKIRGGVHPETKHILVGGAEMYIPVCRRCCGK